MKRCESANLKLVMVPWLICLAAILTVCASGVLYYNFVRFPEADVSEMEADDGRVRFCIDSVSSDKGYLFVQGWVVDEAPLQYVNCAAALRRLPDGCVRKMKTVLQYRDDLPDALNIERAQYGGFRACVDLKLLESDKTYELVLLYRNNGKNCIVNTGVNIDGRGEELGE